MMQKYIITISRTFLCYILIFFLTGCGTVEKLMPEEYIDYPMIIYGASNGKFIRYNYRERTIDKVPLNVELFAPSYRAPYWEVKRSNTDVLLSGSYSMVKVDSENLEARYFPLKEQPCISESEYAKSAGIHPWGMEVIDGQPILIQNLGRLPHGGDKMVLNINQKCIVFDDRNYGISTILMPKGDEISVFLLEQIIYDEEGREAKPKEVVEKKYSKDGIFLEEKVYDTQGETTSLEGYISTKDQEYLLVSDFRKISLLLLSSEGTGKN